MLALDLNEGVASQKKIQESFFIPPDAKAAIAPLVEKYGGVKKKWRIYVAGLLALAQKDEAEVERLIGEVAAADATGGFAELLKTLAEPRLDPQSPRGGLRTKGGIHFTRPAEGPAGRR